MEKQENRDEKTLRELLKETKSSFEVPENYFEDLPSTIINRIKAIPDFNQQAQVNPFVVPEGYFDRLTFEIGDKTTKFKKASFTLYLRNLLQPQFSIPLAFASLVFLILLTIYFKSPLFSPLEKEISFDELKNSTYFVSFDEDMLVEMLPAQKNDPETENIEQYLIDNNIEIFQIEKNL